MYATAETTYTLPYISYILFLLHADYVYRYKECLYAYGVVELYETIFVFFNNCNTKVVNAKRLCKLDNLVNVWYLITYTGFG